MNICTIGLESGAGRALCRDLAQAGHRLTSAGNEPDALPSADPKFDLVLVAEESALWVVGMLAETSELRVPVPMLLLPDLKSAEGDDFRAVRRLLPDPQSASIAPLSIADLTLDPVRQVALRGGRMLRLTRTQYRLLAVLVANAGRVLSREELHRSVWGMEFATSNTVDVHISKLRRIVDDPFRTPLIQTAIGFGYVLSASP